MDQPINVHLTGCPNSCAQHYIGDIGLIGVKVPIGDDDTVPGYNIHVGGGFGTEASIAKMIYPDTKAEEAPARVEGLLKAYLNHRAAPTESFHSFRQPARRRRVEEPRRRIEAEGPVMSAAQHLTVVIPESAPFTPEQRSWLSGFFSASIAAMADAAPVASNDPGPRPRPLAARFSPPTTKRPGTTRRSSPRSVWRWPRTAQSRRA